MVRYSVEPEVPEKTSKTRGSHLRVHFKHCREIAHYTKGMKVQTALKHLDDVLAFKAVIPFVKFTGGIGRKAQAKQCKAPGNIGRWPVKATAVYRDLLKNAIANAETKGLDTDSLVIDHAQVNRAPPGRRRTYRAHGRIGSKEPAAQGHQARGSRGCEGACPRIRAATKSGGARRAPRAQSFRAQQSQSARCRCQWQRWLPAPVTR